MRSLSTTLSGCVVSLSFDGGEAVLEPVTGTVDGDHSAVMEEAVEDGGGKNLVTEHLSPFAEGLVQVRMIEPFS
jgi:hypothetical protein